MTCTPMDTELVLHEGRPENALGRLPKEQRCYDFLEAAQVPFWRVDHDHADTIEQCHGVEAVLGCDICKNLLLTNRQGTAFYLLLLRGDKIFRTKHLSAALGCARLSFAPGEIMEAYLDITPGSLSVLGLMNDHENHVQLVIDKPVLEHEWIGCHPCINTSTLRFSVQDLLDKVLPATKHSPIIVELPEDAE